jgi:ferrous iron transport protein B
MTTLSVALTGNPNTGKSTIFNELTGARQKIGNWPGVTVDKKIGYTKYQDRAISVMDLPGTYSVSARSPEEKIVIDYLLESRPDIVVDVVDASNIERNLFLTVQLLEYNVPFIIDLNMMDEAKKLGVKINVKKLEELIGMLVVETVGRSRKSIHKLLAVFTSTVMENYKNSSLIESHIAKVEELRQSNLKKTELEEDIITLRYALIDKIVAQAVTVEDSGPTISDRVDRVLANGILALPLLLAMIYMIFEITFAWIGQPLADGLNDFVSETLKPWTQESLQALGVAQWLESLVVDGVIAGVGSVLTFVPLIFTLFFLLEFS